MSETPRSRGGQTIYTEAIGQMVCDGLEAGKTLNAVCKANGYPAESTVRQWAGTKDHPFAAKYARAREIGYTRMADDIIDIADDTDGTEATEDRRLRMEARKWLLARALPKVYGDRIEQRLVGADGGPVEIADAKTTARKIAFALARLEVVPAEKTDPGTGSREKNDS